MNLSVELLGNHLELVPVVARWHWNEWGGEYPASSFDEWSEQLQRKTRTDGLPCSWIAFVDGDPVGSVVLELDGVEPQPHLKPDLAGLYVLPAFRSRGVGSALVLACEAGAREFGIRDMYLYTERADTLYERLGWTTIERTRFQGESVAVMQRALEL